MNVKILSVTESLVDYITVTVNKIADNSLKDYLSTTIIMPNRRSIKALKKSLLNQTSSNSRLLPDIKVITDLSSPLHLSIKLPLTDEMKIGTIINVLKKLNYSKISDSLFYANLLGSWLTDFYYYEIDEKRLENIVPNEFSEQWQITTKFLQDFICTWHAELEKVGMIDIALYRVKAIQNTADFWQKTKIKNHIILGGLDGFIPSIDTLINVVKILPRGLVVINGYIPNKESKISETHPNYLTNSITKGCNINAISVREELIAQIMSNDTFDDRIKLTESHFSEVNLIESDDLMAEAYAVSLIARNELDNSHNKIGIITPDNNLTKIIKNYLLRWNINIDCANGKLAIDTVTGKYILYSLDVSKVSDNKIDFLNLMKHPFVTFGYESHNQLLKVVNTLEISYLRNHKKNEKTELFLSLYSHIIQEFYEMKVSGKKYPLSIWILSHLKMCNNFSKDLCIFEKNDVLCQEKEFIYNVLEDLSKSSDSFPELLFTDYKSLIIEYLSSKNIREPLNHRRIKIMSPIQTLYEKFDIVLLCGLNEGVWPKISNNYSMLLNRQMLLQSGFPDPQILIGRSALFFAKTLGNPKVYLSCANNRDNAPAFPSRWIVKLKALHQVNSIKKDLFYKPVKSWVTQLAKSKEKLQYDLPQPMPALEIRPNKFSVSDLEKLFNNPYEVYVKKILKIRPLSGISDNLDSASYGTWVHTILEYIVKKQCYDYIKIRQISEFFLPDIIDNQTKQFWYYNFDNYFPWILSIIKNSDSITMDAEKTLLYQLKVDNSSFNITGKADRVDELIDGTYEIIDYKTGYVPSKKDVISFVKPQLALLALLYEKNNPGKKVTKITYISLKNKELISFSANNIVNEVYEKLITVLKYYTKFEAKYYVNPLSSIKNPYNDYYHLERLQEWFSNRESR